MSHFIRILYDSAANYMRSDKNDNDIVKFCMFYRTLAIKECVTEK